MKFALSLAIAALSLLAAAQDLSILTNSCAANDFIAASTAAGNPCGATDYKCQCTTGKQFTQDFVTKAVTSSGECSLSELTQLPSLAERFCASVAAAPAGSNTSAVATPRLSSTPSSTPGSFAGAASKQAVGGVAGLVGAAALFVL